MSNLQRRKAKISDIEGITKLDKEASKEVKWWDIMRKKA
jgi:hypothetical protein